MTNTDKIKAIDLELASLEAQRETAREALVNSDAHPELCRIRSARVAVKDRLIRLRADKQPTAEAEKELRQLDEEFNEVADPLHRDISIAQTAISNKRKEKRALEDAELASTYAGLSLEELTETRLNLEAQRRDGKRHLRAIVIAIESAQKVDEASKLLAGLTEEDRKKVLASLA